jgi:hypothetical protein
MATKKSSSKAAIAARKRRADAKAKAEKQNATTEDDAASRLDAALESEDTDGDVTKPGATTNKQGEDNPVQTGKQQEALERTAKEDAKLQAKAKKEQEAALKAEKESFKVGTALNYHYGEPDDVNERPRLAFVTRGRTKETADIVVFDHANKRVTFLDNVTIGKKAAKRQAVEP